MMATADLKKRRPDAKMGDSTHFPGSRNVGKKRGAVKNQDKPIGQIALFLLWKLERLGWSPEDFATRLDKAGLKEKTHEAVRKWLNGSNAPRLTEMDTVAKVLGYTDWVAFVLAVGKYQQRRS